LDVLLFLIKAKLTFFLFFAKGNKSFTLKKEKAKKAGQLRFFFIKVLLLKKKKDIRVSRDFFLKVLLLKKKKDAQPFSFLPAFLFFDIPSNVKRSGEAYFFFKSKTFRKKKKKASKAARPFYVLF
jgi:hypothetical protein